MPGLLKARDGAELDNTEEEDDDGVLAGVVSTVRACFTGFAGVTNAPARLCDVYARDNAR